MDMVTQMLNARILVISLLSCLLSLTGCATAPQSYVADGTTFYQSDEYALYRVKRDDTPRSISNYFYGTVDKAWLIEESNPEDEFKPGNYVVVPLKPKNNGGITEQGIQEVAILCYHRFGNQCDSPLCIPAETLERQMRYLHDNGYHVITPEQMVAFLDYQLPLPKKSVMITVDDGYSSFYDVAYPILKKYGFSATLFIYTNFVGVSKKALSWDQLRELKKAGFTIGSHTIAHSDLSKQGENESEKDYQERLRHEVADSKKIIDAKLDQDTMVFAYPFGRANQNAMVAVDKAGYKLAVTVRRGGNPFFTNRYLLNRDQVLKRDMKTFVSRLRTFKPLSLR